MPGLLLPTGCLRMRSQCSAPSRREESQFASKWAPLPLHRMAAHANSSRKADPSARVWAHAALLTTLGLFQTPVPCHQRRTRRLQEHSGFRNKRLSTALKNLPAFPSTKTAEDLNQKKMEVAALSNTCRRTLVVGRSCCG